MASIEQLTSDDNPASKGANGRPFTHARNVDQDFSEWTDKPEPSKFMREIYPNLNGKAGNADDGTSTRTPNDCLAMLLKACGSVDNYKRKIRKGIPRKSAVSGAVQEVSPAASRSNESKHTETSPSSANTPRSTTATEEGVRKRRRLEDIPSVTFGSVDRALNSAPWKLLIWNDDVIAREEKDREKEIAALKEANKFGRVDADGNIVRTVFAGPPECVVEMLVCSFARLNCKKRG